jgi:hypothetical protein
VRFYENNDIVKTHPRVPPGMRSIDPADFPPESLACAQRDAAFFVRQAKEHGEHIGRFAERLAGMPQPWTRMRQIFKLLRLAQKYGARLDASCQVALAADMLDVHKLERLVRLDARPEPPAAAKVIPLARYLRPASQYALPLARRERLNEGEDP